MPFVQAYPIDGEPYNLEDELRGIDKCNHAETQGYSNEDKYNKGYQSLRAEDLVLRR